MRYHADRGVTYTRHYAELATLLFALYVSRCDAYSSLYVFDRDTMRHPADRVVTYTRHSAVLAGPSI